MRLTFCKSYKCFNKFYARNSNFKYCCKQCRNSERSRQNRLKDIKAFRKMRSEYREENREKIREYDRGRYNKNIEIERLKRAIYRLSHPEVKEKYSRSEKGRIRNITDLNNRRSRLRDQNGILTSEEWLDIIKKWDNLCAYCKKLTDNPTQDHVIPLSKGGRHSIDNVVPSCKSCNSKKGTKNVEDFIRGLL